MIVLQKISATVEHGKKLGRKLGFPTANLYVTEDLDIGFGVYVVEIQYQGQNYYGVANYGLRPTIGDNIKAIEVFIFDFNQNLYNQIIDVSFLNKIRNEQKFNSIELLKQQIQNDVNIAHEYITQCGF